MHQRALLAISLVASALLAGCATAPEDVPDDLSAPEMFQRAQEAVDSQNFATAEAYYEAALERFEDDAEVTAIAQYEIAFIHYRRGEYDKAEEGFRELLERYEAGEPGLPEWAEVLSRHLLDRIEERR